MRDIKSFERAMRRHGDPSTLGQRIDAAIHDLNHERPRPVLGGRTAREVFERDRRRLPDRKLFQRAVDRAEGELQHLAVTRAERESARRRAVERVLLAYGYMKQTADVSHNSGAVEATK